MSTRKHACFLVTTLCALGAVSTASAANPAPHVPAPVAAPDKRPAPQPQPAPKTTLQRLAAFVGLGKAPASKLPTHLDLRSSPSHTTAQPAAAPAPRELVFVTGTVDDAVKKLILSANATRIPHKANLMGHELIAYPGDEPAKVRKPYDDAKAASRPKPEAPRTDVDAERVQKIAALGKPLVRTPPPGMKIGPKGKFDDDLMLITPEQLKKLPDGTVLRSINGREAIVGVDHIDGDTRGGWLAYGFQPKHLAGE